MGYVYKITNTVNQKSYIGISIHEPEKGRIEDHLTGKGNRILANSVRKHGRNAFIYEILEENVFSEFLSDLEIHYIKKFNTVTPNGYNLTDGGEVGKKHSLESRRKMSEAKKGRTSHMKGKTHSPETRRKLSEAHKGRRQSAETRRKKSEALRGEKNPRWGKPAPNRGKPRPAETRRKISEALRGEKNHNYGKKHSLETRRKMSESQSKVQKGKIVSPETRAKISEALRGEKHPQWGKPLSEETRRKLSETNRSSEYIPARAFFFSLPTNMDLKEKSRLLRQKITGVTRTTIYRWIRKWTKDV